jgi:hypothetical protein
MVKHWFVTWTTYGSWLPGDPRGFQTWRARTYVPPPKRYAKSDEPTYDAAAYRDEWEMAKQMCPNAVRLTREEQRLALDAIVQAIYPLQMTPRILAIGDWHAHLIAQFYLLPIRPTVGRFKNAATNAIPNPGSRKRIWTDGCHMESLPGTVALRYATDYVRRHAEQGALVYEWQYD